MQEAGEQFLGALLHGSLGKNRYWPLRLGISTGSHETIHHFLCGVLPVEQAEEPVIPVTLACDETTSHPAMNWAGDLKAFCLAVIVGCLSTYRGACLLDIEIQAVI